MPKFVKRERTSTLPYRNKACNRKSVQKAKRAPTSHNFPFSRQIHIWTTKKLWVWALLECWLQNWNSVSFFSFIVFKRCQKKLHACPINLGSSPGVSFFRFCSVQIKWVKAENLITAKHTWENFPVWGNLPYFTPLLKV